MSAVAAALAPIFVLILLGFLTLRAGWLGESFWRGAERLTYFCLFPTLLLGTVAGADLAGLKLWSMFLTLVLSVLAVALALMLSRPVLSRLLGLDGPSFTSVFQGSIRPNTYVALAAAGGLFGEAGLTLAAIGVAAVVPLVNVLSVVVLARHGQLARGNLGSLLARVVGNPIIIGVAVGVLLNPLGGLPDVLADLVDILGRAALPLGLLAVGAGLAPSAVRSAAGTMMFGTAVKLGVLPAVSMALAGILGLEGTAILVALLFTAVPTSASSYVLARQMGGDHTLLAGTLTCQTIVAFATLPLWLAVVV